MSACALLAPMTAATQTSEPANPPTEVVRLLAAARRLVALLLVHWLISCARNLIAGLQLGPTDPDDTFLLRHFGTTDPAVILPCVTRALRRATALEADLHARRPTEQGFSIEACRVIAAALIAICRDLGILRARSIRTIARRTHRRIFHRLRRTPTARRSQARSIGPLRGPIPSRATGPPDVSLRAPLAGAKQPPLVRSQCNAGVPWNFSRRAPASFSLYAVS